MAATTLRWAPPLPDDSELPGAADLLTDVGAGRVARFLEERGRVPQTVEPAQAHYRPGRWLAVCYRTSSVERSSGRMVCLTLTAEHRVGEPEALWCFPDDPALPGLPAAADARLLARRLGSNDGRAHDGGVEVEPLRYRPRRRAVLRYRLAGGQTLFGKVVPPGRGRRLLAVAEALRHSGGGPEPGTARAGDLRTAAGAFGDLRTAGGAFGDLRTAGGAFGDRRAPAATGDLRFTLPVGRVATGALVLPCATGTPLRALLLSGAALPAPDRLARLPEDIHRRCRPVLARGPQPPEPPSGRRRFDPAVALTSAQAVARLLPAEGCAASRLAEAVVAWAEASDQPDEWIVHGDLYENQVLIDGDRFTLIDLDDLGPGDPLLDAANFSAHLLLLAASGASAAGLIGRYRRELLVAFSRAFDVAPAELAWREAYCLLRLATGPFRVLHPDWPGRTAARLNLAREALNTR